MSKEKLIRYIQNIHPVSLDTATTIATRFVSKSIKKGDYLIQEGAHIAETSFLQQGYIHSFTFDADGNQATTFLYAAPCFANDLNSFFKKQPATESLQALTDCDLMVLAYTDLDYNFHNIPEYKEFGRMLLVNSYTELKIRTLSFVQQTAEQRYLNLIRTMPEIFKHVSLKVIASYLGITDTSLSRIRKKISHP